MFRNNTGKHRCPAEGHLVKLILTASPRWRLRLLLGSTLSIPFPGAAFKVLTRTHHHFRSSPHNTAHAHTQLTIAVSISSPPTGAPVLAGGAGGAAGASVLAGAAVVSVAGGAGDASVLAASVLDAGGAGAASSLLPSSAASSASGALRARLAVGAAPSSSALRVSDIVN